MRQKLSWWLFIIKYKLGLAREGVDFITCDFANCGFCPHWEKCKEEFDANRT